jgi:hypothetical protein
VKRKASPSPPVNQATTGTTKKPPSSTNASKKRKVNPVTGPNKRLRLSVTQTKHVLLKKEIIDLLAFFEINHNLDSFSDLETGFINTKHFKLFLKRLKNASIIDHAVKPLCFDRQVVKEGLEALVQVLLVPDNRDQDYAAAAAFAFKLPDSINNEIVKLTRKRWNEKLHKEASYCRYILLRFTVYGRARKKYIREKYKELHVESRSTVAHGLALSESNASSSGRNAYLFESDASSSESNASSFESDVPPSKSEPDPLYKKRIEIWKQRTPSQ